MHQITRYVCDICGSEYETERAARLCESRPIREPKAAVGSSPLFAYRYAEDNRRHKVVGHSKPYRPMWLAYADTDNEEHWLKLLNLIAEEPDVCVHERQLVLEEPVRFDHKWEDYCTEVSDSYVLEELCNS